MRIDDWPCERILRLPDWCFGRRYLVSCSVVAGAAAPAWDISELSFPEHVCIWEISAYSDALSVDLLSFRMALGKQLPTSTAMMDANEPLFNGLGAQGPGPRAITMPYVGDMRWNMLRFCILTANRRLILEATGAEAKTPTVTIGVTVSSVPKEVPDWLISAQAINLP